MTTTVHHPLAEGPETGIARSVHLLKLFRKEAVDPDRFYHYLAADVLRHISRYQDPAGALALDIGGGPGYTAEALRAAGAHCVVGDYSLAELGLHNRKPDNAVQCDAQALPLRNGSMGIVYSSNVLEHVPMWESMLSEMVRVLEPETGLGYLTFTNWYSPWGGHETSPWHYLGGRRAVERYERKYGKAPKNEFGVSLYRLHIRQVLDWFNARDDLDILWVGPRYMPEWMRWIEHVPGIREIVTWNLVVVFRRRAVRDSLSRWFCGIIVPLLRAYAGTSVVVVLPGLLVASIIGLRLRELLTWAAIPAFSLATVFLLGEITLLLRLPFGLPAFAVLLVALGGVLLFVRSRRARPSGTRDETRRPERSERADGPRSQIEPRFAEPIAYVLLVLGIALGAFTWYRGLRGVPLIPPGADATRHGWMVARILYDHTMDMSKVLTWDASGTHQIIKYYPLGLHACAALSARLCGQRYRPRSRRLRRRVQRGRAPARDVRARAHACTRSAARRRLHRARELARGSVPVLDHLEWRCHPARSRWPRCPPPLCCCGGQCWLVTHPYA